MKHLFAAAFALLLLAPVTALGHCQVPCGIYDDTARIDRMLEDTDTIEKSILAIIELADTRTDAKAMNQMVRWVTTKEDHASDIISIISEYFLAQKVKPVAAGAEGRETYLAKLADHHAVMSAAMKTKQDANAETARTLRAAIETLKKHYNYEDHTH
ncbi:MAG: superoxide dismutase [Gemmatimonadetes bacterium]|nr:superoxide dismutase [Gemmatimonadota bacterium]